MVGLSGLITPSLDEMVRVAEEMERRGLEIPLLIGGATTSKQHTAVRIAPAYSEATLHVADASRAVHTVASLLDEGSRRELSRKNRESQELLRSLHAEKAARPLRSYQEACANRPKIEWRAEDIATPSFLGRRVLRKVPLAELAKYIDWTFFFSAWELKGRFPESSSIRGTARRPGSSSTTPPHCWRRSPSRASSRRTASTASGPPPPTATTSSSSRTPRAPRS